MNYLYYEPISDKIYLAKWEVGSTTKYLPLATDGQFTCPWHLENKETLFYYLGEL